MTKKDSLGTGLVRAPVEDELTLSAGERPQLQPPAVTREERVVLNDLDRPLVGERRDPGRQGIDALDARLDLDVACHRARARIRRTHEGPDVAVMRSRSAPGTPATRPAPEPHGLFTRRASFAEDLVGPLDQLNENRGIGEGRLLALQVGVEDSRALEHAPQTWIGMPSAIVARSVSATGGQPTGTTAAATGSRISETASPRRKIWAAWPASANAFACRNGMRPRRIVGAPRALDQDVHVGPVVMPQPRASPARLLIVTASPMCAAL